MGIGNGTAAPIKIRYSRDKYLKAVTLSIPLRKLAKVEYEEINGEGVLEFINKGIVYREKDWPYLVARLLNQES